MAAELSEQVRKIAEARDLSESEVFEQALERGLEDIWEDIVLERYFDEEITRKQAVDLVGRTKLERAERERDAVEADVAWGLDA